MPIAETTQSKGVEKRIPKCPFDGPFQVGPGVTSTTSLTEVKSSSTFIIGSHNYRRQEGDGAGLWGGALGWGLVNVSKDRFRLPLPEDRGRTN